MVDCPFLAWNVLYRTVLPKKAIIPVLRQARAGALMTRQDRRWLAISIVWLLTLGVLLYLGFA